MVDFKNITNPQTLLNNILLLVIILVGADLILSQLNQRIPNILANAGNVTAQFLDVNTGNAEFDDFVGSVAILLVLIISFGLILFVQDVLPFGEKRRGGGGMGM